MIGTYNYVLYTNDTDFLARNWKGYLAAMNHIYAKVQPSPSGLLNVTGTRDWARWQTGFNMSSAQMILYRTLTTGADLAAWQGGGSSDSNSNSNTTTDLPALWTQRAAALQNATLAHCFDASYGAFRDNATATALHPQDANAMAVLFGVVGANTSTARSISSRLTDSWTPIGAEAPELPGNISPFISSFEIQAHLAAGETSRALDLIRTSWGWYLGNANGTQSTVVEGYLVNGTFGYRWSRGYGNDFSYVSHAHGWSSGPTSALTEFVLGLTVTARVGSAWSFAPQFGGLSFAEGGFMTGLGKFQARWDVADESGAGVGYNASVSTPAGTAGTLVLPVVQQGIKPHVTVDGEEVQVDWFRKTGVVFDTVVVEGVEGGDRTIVVS